MTTLTTSDQKIALVTGASRGIGAAIAMQLQADGFFVVGTATSAAGAQAITERHTASGVAGGIGLVLDVRDHAAIDALIGQIEQQYGAVAVLVNNAGITKDNLLLRMKSDDWNDIINVHLNAVFHLSKRVLKGMAKARFGRIINISSVSAKLGNAGQTNYAAAKAGMVGFSKSLAREVGSRGITVNCVAPGFIDTDMTRALPEAQRQALIEHVPLGRLGSVQDIAAATAFLASDAAAYITGATLHVNGGMYMD